MRQETRVRFMIIAACWCPLKCCEKLVNIKCVINAYALCAEEEWLKGWSVAAAATTKNVNIQAALRQWQESNNNNNNNSHVLHKTSVNLTSLQEHLMERASTLFNDMHHYVFQEIFFFSVLIDKERMKEHSPFTLIKFQRCVSLCVVEAIIFINVGSF